MGQSNKEILLAGFYAGGRLMAMDAFRVDEIVRLPAVTPVPGAPPYVYGVINLRGAIVVVIDLARRIGLVGAEEDCSAAFDESDRRVLIVSNAGESVGFLVDAADDVIETSKNDFKDAPPNIQGNENIWFTGMYDGPRGLASILDVSALLNED